MTIHTWKQRTFYNKEPCQPLKSIVNRQSSIKSPGIFYRPPGKAHYCIFPFLSLYETLVPTLPSVSKPQPGLEPGKNQRCSCYPAGAPRPLPPLSSYCGNSGNFFYRAPRGAHAAPAH